MTSSKICIDEEMSSRQFKMICIHDPIAEKIRLHSVYSNEDMDIQMSFCAPVNFCPFCGKRESKEDKEDI
jgi:hypothetical protein